MESFSVSPTILFLPVVLNQIFCQGIPLLAQKFFLEAQVLRFPALLRIHKILRDNNFIKYKI